MSKPTILVIEDDLDLQCQLQWVLSDSYTVLTASDRQTALACLQKVTPCAVTLDLGLSPRPDEALEGLTVLQAIVASKPSVKVIVLTGTCDVATARYALHCGAFDYLYKPIDVETLRLTLRRAAFRHELEEETQRVHDESVGERFHGMVGTSLLMRQLYDRVQRVAGSDLSVLVLGESGTGKELVARAIHEESARREHPFITISCGAIPDTLLESELFGHEKGVFTGAHQQRKGRIELAHRGTLFLDEIGELSLALQVKLLRFLEERVVDRIGGRRPIPVDTRVVAATNVNLPEALARGRFRADLYYRLNVVQIPMPPLRDREGDASKLAEAFVIRDRKSLNPRVLGLSEAACGSIRSYPWPGNVRELENRVKRALVLAESPILQPADLGLPPIGQTPIALTLCEAREQFDKAVIRQTLIRTNGNVARTAEALGVTRQAIYNFIERLGLSNRLTVSRM